MPLRPHAPGVGRPNHAGDVIRQQHRGAVRHEHAQREVLFTGHEGVGGFDGGGRRCVDRRDCVRVQLLHPHKALLGQTENVREASAVCGDGVRVVAYVGAQVEGVVRGSRNPACTGSEHHADGAGEKIWHDSQLN